MREILKTRAEVEEEAAKWQKVERAMVGAGLWLIFTTSGPVGVARVHRLRTTESLYRSLSHLPELAAPKATV